MLYLIINLYANISFINTYFSNKYLPNDDGGTGTVMIY